MSLLPVGDLDAQTPTLQAYLADLDFSKPPQLELISVVLDEFDYLPEENTQDVTSTIPVETQIERGTSQEVTPVDHKDEPVTISQEVTPEKEVIEAPGEEITNRDLPPVSEEIKEESPSKVTQEEAVEQKQETPEIPSLDEEEKDISRQEITQDKKDKDLPTQQELKEEEKVETAETANTQLESAESLPTEEKPITLPEISSVVDVLTQKDTTLSTLTNGANGEKEVVGVTTAGVTYFLFDSDSPTHSVGSSYSGSPQWADSPERPEFFVPDLSAHKESDVETHIDTEKETTKETEEENNKETPKPSEKRVRINLDTVKEHDKVKDTTVKDRLNLRIETKSQDSPPPTSRTLNRSRSDAKKSLLQRLQVATHRLSITESAIVQYEEAVVALRANVESYADANEKFHSANIGLEDHLLVLDLQLLEAEEEEGRVSVERDRLNTTLAALRKEVAQKREALQLAHVYSQLAIKSQEQAELDAQQAEASLAAASRKVL